MMITHTHTIHNIHTLHVLSLATRMFRAAKSLCTNIFLSKYSMPLTMSWQYLNSLLWVPCGTASPGVLCVCVCVCVCLCVFVFVVCVCLCECVCELFC